MKKNKTKPGFPIKKKKEEHDPNDDKYRFYRADLAEAITVVPNSCTINRWRKGEGLDGDEVFFHAKITKYADLWETYFAVCDFVGVPYIAASEVLPLQEKYADIWKTCF